MRPQPLGQIRPKISTMPRQQTEAAAYLEIYKLVNERKRLQQELDLLEQRRDRILQRLDVLTGQVAEMEQTAQVLRAAENSPATPIVTPVKPAANEFSTLFLEY